MRTGAIKRVTREQIRSAAAKKECDGRREDGVVSSGRQMVSCTRLFQGPRVYEAQHFQSLVLHFPLRWGVQEACLASRGVDRR